MADIIIVGAGITGLATAIALHRITGNPFSGRIRVIEQSAAPREVGAGLQIGPNAVKTLAYLGLTDLASAGASTPLALRVMDGRSGRVISQSPLGNWIERRHGAPYYTMSRADLLGALLQRAQHLGVDIVHGCGLREMQRRKQVWALTFDTGEEIEANVLIGADGLWSTVRKSLAPATRPKFTGQTAWRTILPMAEVPETIDRYMVTLWLAPGFHAVHYPIEQNRRLNLALFTEGGTDAIGWDAVGEKSDLIAHIAASGVTPAGPMTEMMSAAEKFIKWPMFGLEPSIAAGVGAATLVGDAAHPMLPYLAQGAAMGLEDAVVLAEEISSAGDFEPGFRAYERTRARRVARVQRGARSNARNFHLSGPAASLRNTVLGIGENLVPGALLRRYDWLYGGGPIS